MAKYINVENLIKSIGEYYNEEGWKDVRKNYAFGEKELIYFLNGLKDKKSIEVVRCAECEYRDGEDIQMVCTKRNDFTGANEYCSRGKKKEGR